MSSSSSTTTALECDGWLPFEVLLHLFAFVSSALLKRSCQRVCRLWRNAAFERIRIRFVSARRNRLAGKIAVTWKRTLLVEGGALFVAGRQLGSNAVFPHFVKQALDASAIDSIWDGYWGVHFIGRNGEQLAFIRFGNNAIEWKGPPPPLNDASNNNKNEEAATALDPIIDFAATTQVAIGVTASGAILMSNTTQQSPDIKGWRAASCDVKAVRVAAHGVIGSVWVLDEDGAVHRIDDIATQQQEGATMRKERMAGFGGGVRIVDMMCGWSHTVALSSEGACFSWGFNPFGQLGLGRSGGSYAMTPQRIGGLPHIVLLACGFRSYHSMAMSEEGRCWAWGRNENGELGLGDKMSRDSPTLVEGVEGVRDALLAAWASFVELENGELWACGGNNYGRLGVDSIQENVLTPTPITKREQQPPPPPAATKDQSKKKKDCTVQ